MRIVQTQCLQLTMQVTLLNNNGISFQLCSNELMILLVTRIYDCTQVASNIVLVCKHSLVLAAVLVCVASGSSSSSTTALHARACNPTHMHCMQSSDDT